MREESEDDTAAGGGAVRHNKNGAEIESVYRRQGLPITYEIYILDQHGQGQVTWLV